MLFFIVFLCLEIFCLKCNIINVEKIRLDEYLRSLQNYTDSNFTDSELLYKNNTTWPVSNLAYLKILYDNQREILDLVTKIVSLRNYTLNNLLKRSQRIDDLLDLNLLQLLLLENLIPKFQDVKAHDKLVSKIIRVIKKNQNPKICRNIEVLTYEVRSFCGFGCQIHHLAYLLQIALGKGKPLVIKETGWHRFSSIFDLILPLSLTCKYDMIKQNNLKEEFIDVQYDYPNQKYKPQILPVEIKSEIEKFNGSPFVWWMGKLVAYILRLQNHTVNRLKPIRFKRPIVGVHVRRTDKLLGEAKCYPTAKYMDIVELYFRKLELKQNITKKYVYISSDDPAVIKTLRRRYPEYTFLTSKVKRGAGRYTKFGTYSILSDIYHLSRTDYLVCTFSSNVCRLAYEWMNSRYVDASERYYSLDTIYFYARQKAAIYLLLVNHTVKNITFKADTKVKWIKKNDLSEATVEVVDTNQVINIPLYKLKELPMTEEFKAFGN